MSSEIIDYATKEHTSAFKKAVEGCKAANPEKDASSCFAMITSAFQKANKPIFMASFEELLGELPTFDYQEILLAEKFNDEFFKAELSRIKSDTNMTKDAKHKSLSELIATAGKAGIELADEIFDLLSYATYDYEKPFASPSSSLQDEITVELSGTVRSWKSLGHALQVTEELIRPGVFQGIDGRKCRWTDAVLGKYSQSLLGQPARTFHVKEGLYRKDLPSKAGKIVGFITHVAEYAGRVFTKTMVYPKPAQDLVKSGKYRSSMEARVALSTKDASGTHDVRAWQGIGLAYTDNPAVRKDDPQAQAVALSRKKKMPDPPTDPNPPADPATTPPADPAIEAPDQVTLSSKVLEDVIKSAVEKATVELAGQIKEMKDQFDSVSTDLKAITDERGVAILAEVNAMVEDIKKEDETFDPKMLYAEDESVSDKKKSLEIYIRGINKGAQLSKKPPTITLADPETLAKEDDALCLEVYGMKYDELLAAPASAIEGGQE